MRFEGFGRWNRGGRGRPFWFEPFWLKEEACKEVIKRNWVALDSHTHSDLLGEVKVQLENYSINLQGWSKKNFRGWKRKHESLARLRDDADEENVISKIRRLEKDVEVLLYREESYWRQCSRAKWLVGGDKKYQVFS